MVPTLRNKLPPCVINSRCSLRAAAVDDVLLKLNPGDFAARLTIFLLVINNRGHFPIRKRDSRTPSVIAYTIAPKEDTAGAGNLNAERKVREEHQSAHARSLAIVYRVDLVNHNQPHKRSIFRTTIS